MNKEKLYKIIGKNIKKYRKEYNKKSKMTQEMLAEAVGVSTSLISKLESKKAIQGISISTVYRISIVLDRNISDFLE